MKTKFLIVLLLNIFVGVQIKAQANVYTLLAQNTLDSIYKYYPADEKYLLNETYPFNPKNVADYTASTDTIKKKRVAYLWPTSGVFSGVNALLRTTGDAKYRKILDSQVIPGLDLYFDSIRKPVCYQSYLTAEGRSDRFYDDNVWLAIDFAESYLETKDKKYLAKSEMIWKFVISGWDDKLGGGIYWCEQKKHSKNTCSNAPSVVAAMKLYEGTQNKEYLDWAIKIYKWTKTNLQDTTDFLYFDNVGLDNHISKAKYEYNSGQMLQGAVLLYNHTHDKAYLTDAKNIANSAVKFFVKPITKDGVEYMLFKKRDPWFVTVMFRGYLDLYLVDKDPTYINVFKANIDYIKKYVRSNKGLFEGDWSGERQDEFKWLLNQGCIVELSANLGGLK